MENNEAKIQTEQTVETHPAAAEESLGEEVSLGKFKDVRSLLKAYGALEAEFTKKCQKIRALEGEITAYGEKAKEGAFAPSKGVAEENAEETDTAIAAFLAKRKNAAEFLPTLKQSFSGKGKTTEREVEQAYVRLLEEARGKERAEAVRACEQARVEAVRDYVKAVAKTSISAPVLTDVGQVSVAPPIRPKNFEEAGALARTLFHKNHEN
ncbi:MAG: hypothetical protein E7363_01940 [Clostridiales bacterium]|nr:hypothetical protein [Clostridiales bacterium]